MFLQLLSVSHLLCFPTFRVRDEAPIKMKRRTDSVENREGKGNRFRGEASLNVAGLVTNEYV